MLVERLSQSLPEGIEVEMDGRYVSMFSYKRKNYALLDESGKVIIRGSGLRSRGMEKYLREFLSAMIRLLLEGKGEQVYSFYEDFCRATGAAPDGHCLAGKNRNPQRIS